MNDRFELFGKVFPFWESLEDRDKRIFEEGARLLSFKKGEAVHSEGKCSGAYIVKKGGLRVYMLSDEGREVTLYRLYENDVCMLSASCVIEAITFDVYIDAIEKSECELIPASVMLDMSNRYPLVKIFALETALERFSDVMWVMQQILFMSMDRRLSVFLLEESERVNSNTLKMTHEQLASYVASAREVVSRTLKYLSDEGAVRVSRSEGIKIVDRNKLRLIAN